MATTEKGTAKTGAKTTPMTKKTTKAAAAAPSKVAAKATPTKAAPAAVKPVKAPAKKEAPAAKITKAPKIVKPPLDENQRRHYVEVAAYFMAERRGFMTGCESEDWLVAEAEIDRLFHEGKLNA